MRTINNKTDQFGRYLSFISEIISKSGDIWYNGGDMTNYFDKFYICHEILVEMLTMKTISNVKNVNQPYNVDNTTVYNRNFKYNIMREEFIS